MHIPATHLFIYIPVVLKIRLQRIGRTNRPQYRVVVVEHTVAAKKNKYVDLLGYYNPLLPKKSFNVDSDRLFDWIKKGAKPTNTIARLLKGQGVKGMEPFIIEMKDRKKKGEEAAAPAAAAKPAEEKPAEEKPTA